jgi:hypothetical protein
LEKQVAIIIDDNDETHPAATENIISTDDVDELDLLATADIINASDKVPTPETEIPNSYPNQTKGQGGG